MLLFCKRLSLISHGIRIFIALTKKNNCPDDKHVEKFALEQSNLYIDSGECKTIYVTVFYCYFMFVFEY